MTRVITPAEFARKFAEGNDLRRMYNAGVRFFEVANEVNAESEGLGGAWHDGAGFALWFNEVVDRLRPHFPDARFLFPGLMPQPSLSAMYQFLEDAQPATRRADGICFHAYFANENELRSHFAPGGIVYEYRRRFPGALLMCSEFSNPLPGVDKATKARQYIEFYECCGQLGVHSAYAFVVSASDPAFSHETWRDESGALSPIPAIVGARPARVTPPPVEPPPPPAPTNLLGLHVVIGPRTGYGDFLRALSAAGRPCPLVFAVDEGGALLEAKGIDARTVTIFRTKAGGDTPGGNWSGDPAGVAESYMAAQMAAWARNPADYYAILNEPSPPDLAGYRWMDAFMVRAIQIASAAGYRACAYNFAAGNPPSLDYLEALLPSLRLLRDTGGCFATHSYGMAVHGGDGTLCGSPATTLHYRAQYRDVLAPAGLGNLPLAITEVAPSPLDGGTWESRGREAWVDDMVAFADEAARDPYMIGLAGFTLGDGGGEWAGWNYQDALPLLAARVEERR